MPIYIYNSYIVFTMYKPCIYYIICIYYIHWYILLVIYWVLHWIYYVFSIKNSELSVKWWFESKYKLINKINKNKLVVVKLPSVKIKKQIGG